MKALYFGLVAASTGWLAISHGGWAGFLSGWQLSQDQDAEFEKVFSVTYGASDIPTLKSWIRIASSTNKHLRWHSKRRMVELKFLLWLRQTVGVTLNQMSQNLGGNPLSRCSRCVCSLTSFLRWDEICLAGESPPPHANINLSTWSSQCCCEEGIDIIWA